MLRPYQSPIVDRILATQPADRLMAQLPTGGGKSVIFGEATKAFTGYFGNRVMVIAHREELIVQAARHLGNFCGADNVAIVKSGYPMQPDRPVQVASIQSLFPNRIHQLGRIDRIIIDEAHHSTASQYRQAMDFFPAATIIGLTATPIRLNGEGFADLFHEMVCGPQTIDLINDGYLSPFKYFADPAPIQTKGVRSRQGDYSQSELEKANDSGPLSGNLIKSYLRHCDGLRCAVFALSIAHSKAITEAYSKFGIKAAHLDGNSDRHYRADTLAAFIAGDIKVLSNVGLFGEGVDIPALEAIQVARPTKSLSFYLQMCGRVLRTAPGKEHGIIIDHTNNWLEHGLPDTEREWDLDGVRRKGKPKKAVATEAGEVIEQEELPIAPDIEGAEDTRFADVGSMPRPQRPERKATEVLTPDERRHWSNTIKSLQAQAEARGYKPRWMEYRLLELKAPLPVWKWYARHRGYKEGYAWMKWRECA